MTIAVLADELLKQEFLNRAFPKDLNIVYADSLRSLEIIEADACFDLLFEPIPERIHILKKIAARCPVVLNSIVDTCAVLGEDFIRINAWPSMLKREIAEIATRPSGREKAQLLFDSLQWPVQFVPDVTGLITPRIVAMIINEAHYALGEKVSSREEIDQAMRLGTNYPYGPFEWTEIIGKSRIVALLHALNQSAGRYTIAPLLAKSEQP